MNLCSYTPATPLQRLLQSRGEAAPQHFQPHTPGNLQMLCFTMASPQRRRTNFRHRSRSLLHLCLLCCSSEFSRLSAAPSIPATPEPVCSRGRCAAFRWPFSPTGALGSAEGSAWGSLQTTSADPPASSRRGRSAGSLQTPRPSCLQPSWPRPAAAPFVH